MFKTSHSYFLGLLALLLFLSAFAMKQGEKDTIIIGTGGGYSGQVTMYTIDSKGNIFLESGIKDETKPFGKMSGKDLCRIKKEIKKSEFSSQNLREPGNIYYFIETVHKGKNHKVTWGAQPSDDAKKMQSLYTFILEKINQSKI